MWPRSAVRAFAAVLLLAGAAAAAAPAAAAIRGASPEVLDRYIPVKGQFQCFDQSRSIDAAKVNDNFCDCPDGSDEPGTHR
jgi:protein kinase C substrate 80K-H